MVLEKIEKLVTLIDNSSMTQFSYKDKDMAISMSKLSNPSVIPAASTVAPAATTITASTSPAADSASKEEENKENDFIVSPIIGTFYVASSPEAAPFVKVGDKVKPGQTVCIIEAMKTMNEISADYECEIEAVLVGNEQKVEYGHKLFRVKRL